MPTDAAPKHTPGKDCVVCGHPLKSKACTCPWSLGFDQWPSVKLATVKAMVYGGPFAGS